jgi:citrate lyase subunit beta/citryl-CoA lyase
MTAPVVTLLYAPADRPELVTKALASTADVVVIDLEDAVAPARKADARSVVAGAGAGADRPVQVRVNARGTVWYDEDVALVAALPHEIGVRLPKVETSAQVVELIGAVGARPVHLLLESALGVERAYELASVPGVATVGLGEADLRADLRCDEDGLGYARSRVVLAARAAGLAPPAMSVYPNVRDPDGLRTSCRAGRALGFCGRAAIHPAQLVPIREAFAPAPDEVARAREVVERLERAHAAGVGAVVLEDGAFLDAAMVEQARWVLALAAATGG